MKLPHPPAKKRLNGPGSPKLGNLSSQWISNGLTDNTKQPPKYEHQTEGDKSEIALWVTSVPLPRPQPPITFITSITYQVLSVKPTCSWIEGVLWHMRYGRVVFRPRVKQEYDFGPHNTCNRCNPWLLPNCDGRPDRGYLRGTAGRSLAPRR